MIHTLDTLYRLNRYPQLLDAILVALRSRDKGAPSRHLQLEAIRTVGILGALAPNKLEVLRRGGSPFLLAARQSTTASKSTSCGYSHNGSSATKAPSHDNEELLEDEGDSDDEADEDGGIGPNYVPQGGADGAGLGNYDATTNDVDTDAAISAAAELAMPEPSNGDLEPLEAYYPRVSLTALVKLLKYSNEVKYAVKATMHICSCFDQSLLDVYLAPAMCGYMDAIRRTDLGSDTVCTVLRKRCVRRHV